MREFDLFQPWQDKPAPIRFVSKQMRTIKERIIATYRDKRYYDGDRNCGYGGYSYDGRWKPIAKFIIDEYQLSNDATILQLGCEKGFLLHDIQHLYPDIQVYGYEVSSYAISNAMPNVRDNIRHGSFISLPYSDHSFDLVLAMGVVYTLNLTDAIQCLREINRVSKGGKFITLGAYETEEERRLFSMWTLLGATILHKKEWLEVLRYVDYDGDYCFTTAKSLNLINNEQARKKE